MLSDISDPSVALRYVAIRSCAKRGAVTGCGANIVTVRSGRGQDECLVSRAGYLLLRREQMTRRARSGIVDSCFSFPV